jgi:hypothetical protein
MADPPHYVVTVEYVEDIEDLLDWAYAAANRRPYVPTTEHWPVPNQSGCAFCFKDIGAALAFIVYCKQSGIPCKGGW